MDSIERMRKINDLTKELKQRGFAESSFEAIQQANQIYGKDSVSPDVHHAIIPNAPTDAAAEGVPTSGAGSYVDKKITKVVENVDALTAKMNEIIRAINDLDGRLTELKIKQEKMAMQVRSEPRVESRPEPKFEPRVEQRSESRPEPRQESRPEPQAPVQGHVHKEEYEANQKVGNYQSTDVSIDKMFYYGNKK